MNMIRFIGLLIILPLISQVALASETWRFRSAYDSFQITKEGRSYIYQGKSIPGDWAEELRPVLDNAMNIECPDLPKKPDLRLHWSLNGVEIKRRFYLDAKMASDGKSCLALTGQGIYYAPFHKAWFVGDEKLSLDISKGFEIGSRTQSWAKFVQDGNDLKPSAKNFYPNWEMVLKLRTILKEFPLQGRAHPKIVDDPLVGIENKQVVIRTRNKEYVFHRVADNTWLMKLPKVPWLILSNQFGFLEGMKKSDWDSQHAGELNTAMNLDLDDKARIAAIRALQAKSTREVHEAFHQILLNPSDKDDVKAMVVQVLRNYPSMKNIRALVEALDKTQSNDLLYNMMKVLRLRNPKGPSIDMNADKVEVEEAINTWRKWADRLENKAS